MITIKDKQMQVIRNIMFTRFIDTVYKLITINYPEILAKLVKEQALNKLIHYSQTASNLFGLKEPAYLYQFCILALQNTGLQGPNYPDAITEILTWPNRNDERKITLLNKYFERSPKINNYEFMEPMKR